MICVRLISFSSAAVCIVLASLPYDDADHIRGKGAFVAAKGAGGPG